LAAAAIAPALTGGGCAGVKKQSTTGSGGTGLTGFGGSSIGPPPIPGLESLTVTPATADVTLTAGTAGTLTGMPVQFTATGVVNGVSMNVTTMVGWDADLKGVLVSAGLATASAPGSYVITAKSGTTTAHATLTATFSGDITATGFSGNKGVLDGNSSGTTNMLYPVDHQLFPANLAPIYAQMTASGSGASARLNFSAT